jgi:arylsulfatase A-like enzyme
VEGEDGIALLSSPILATPEPAPRRVLFLVQDALRADHLTPYSASRPTSPFTDRLAGLGALFRRCLAQAPSTRMSVASYFTSLHPTATGVRTFDQVLAEEYVTLAEVLRHRGWSTVSVVENSNAGPLAGLHQGFDRVVEVAEPDGTLENLVPGVLDELPEGRPALVYVHLLDPHGPFDPPSEHRAWLEALDGSIEPVVRSDLYDPPWVTHPSRQGRVARYDGEIATNDRALEVLFGRLDRLGWLDSTLVVMASDHGEYLGEHGEWGHHSPGRAEVLHTPLLLIDRGRIPAGLVVEQPVQNLDVLPTILEMVGLDPGLLPFEGRSLAPLLDGELQPPQRLAFSEEPRRERDIPLGRHGGSFAFGTRFVLHSPPIYHRLFEWNGRHVDDGSTRLSDPFASEVSALLRALHSQHQAIADTVAAGREQTVEVDPAAIDNLRALGYVVDE